MANLKSDALLDAGYIGLMLEHPVTKQLAENLIPINYPQNKPGVAQYVKDVSAGPLSDAHEGKSKEDVALIIFAELAQAKEGPQYIIDAMSGSAKAVKAAKAAAKLETWRQKLDAPDMTDSMQVARDLFAALEAAQAQIAKLEADIEDARQEVADKLDIDKTFDLAIVSSGWYVAEKTEAKGSRKKVTRDYSADTYTSGERTINGVKVTSTATVTKRDDEGNPSGWKVTYNAQGKTWTETGETLHATHKTVREACMSVIAPDAETAINSPKWFSVPRIVK